MNDLYLVHFGVKGMKWGVRKDRTRGSTKRKRKSKKQKEDISKLSNEELQTRIRRMQLEDQYTQLSKKRTSAGKVVVTAILATAGKEAAKNYVSKKFGTKLNSLDDALSSKITTETSYMSNYARLKKMGLI